MRGKIIPLTPDQIVTRAVSQINAPIMYHLEYPNGGTDPQLPSPSDPHVQQADCIGFATWASGFDRFSKEFPLYDGYINTDSMIEAPTTWFQKHETPAPGMMIVAHTYNASTGHRIGHIGVIVDVHDATKPDGIGVVHCSPSNYKHTGNHSAIWKTDATIWFNYYPKHYYITLTKAPNVTQ